MANNVNWEIYPAGDKKKIGKMIRSWFEACNWRGGGRAVKGNLRAESSSDRVFIGHNSGNESLLRMRVDFEGFCIVRSGNFTKNALCVTFTKRFSSSSQLRSNILAIRAPWREMNIFHVFYALTVDFNTILYRESISDPSFSFAAVFSQ